jgi:energy-converting hydrogenase Eha subunit C
MAKKHGAPDNNRSRLRRLLPVTAAVAVLGGIVFLFRRSDIHHKIRNRYLLFTGMMGSMAAVLFLLFRMIRFLVRLYP